MDKNHFLRRLSRLLALLFHFNTTWFIRAVPSLFLRDMYRALSIPRHDMPPRTAHYSPMLHNALLSIAVCYSDDPKIQDPRIREMFATEAGRLWQIEAAKPNIAVVQALAMLSSYHSSHLNPTVGHVYFAMSARLSQFRKILKYSKYESTNLKVLR